MTKVVYIFIFLLTLAQLSCCVPQIAGLNAELSKKNNIENKSSQESEKEAEKEKEKEESSLTRLNELSEKVITQFYYLSNNIVESSTTKNLLIVCNPITNQNSIYLQYSNLRI